MQTTDDGEYIPSRELDKTFKIPKKKPEPDGAPSAAPPVMENSYFNYNDYVPDPCPSALFPAPPVPDLQVAETFILQNLQKREYEKPKTYSNHILQDTIPDLFDDTLPRDLITQFQPLFCKLCSAQLSSNVVARLHYKSKNHEKKIKQFLITYATETGGPVHPRANVVGKTKDVQGAEGVNPMYFYCEVCDLPLTGKLHAESHYLGKNHRKAVLGAKKPAGKGHYDSSGKWIRQQGKKRALDSDDDGFGNEFRPPAPSPTAPVIGVACYPPQLQSSNFRCEMCNVTATTQDQLVAHVNGQKHRKKLKKHDGGLGYDVSDTGDPSVFLPSPIVVTPDPIKTDVSLYTTPSGQFYCPVCNCTMNSEIQFKQHMQSKNHLKKGSQKNA